MVQVIERPPSFGEMMGRGLGGGISHGINKGMEFAQQMQLEKQKALSRKKEDEHISKEEALSSIKDMRGIIERGNTGMNFFNMLTGEGRGDRAALDTAALSIERLAASMVGKGTLSKERFKYLKDRLPSGFKTDAENIKILDEWEKILGGHGGGSEKSSEVSGAKTKFDPSNPEHQAKAKQLYKTHKNDVEKVRKDLKREFEGVDAY